MADKQRYKKREVIEALQQARGIKAVAARLLGCEWETVNNYCKRYPECQAVIDNRRTEICDYAENHVWNGIIKGDIELCKWALKTLGKDRGYVERQEQTGIGGQPIEIIITRRIIHDRDRDKES